jgi:hypothetical protein
MLCWYLQQPGEPAAVFIGGAYSDFDGLTAELVALPGIRMAGVQAV